MPKGVREKVRCSYGYSGSGSYRPAVTDSATATRRQTIRSPMR
jgi:hypothetical protein